MRLIATIAALILGETAAACAKVPAPQAVAGVQAAAPWLSLPPTPALPRPDREGRVQVDGAFLWYGEFGVEHGGVPVLLLHGGLANSSYFGTLIPALVGSGRHVIALDSRGHGRSTASSLPYSYALMARDVIALLDQRGLDKVDVVGWSDGGTIGYQLGLTAPNRVNRLVVFGANATLDGLKDGYGDTATFQAYIARTEVEYRALSPDPDDYAAFLDGISGMWASEPVETVRALSAIPFPVAVMIGEYDEALKLDHVRAISNAVPHGTLIVLPSVSHFAMLQAPGAFDSAVLRALDRP